MIDTNITYLNTAACGLLAPEVKAAGFRLYDSIATEGSSRAEEWRFNEEARIRKAIAGFLGASDANIAMIPNFSWGMNAIVHALKGNERVLLYAGDYPSVCEPFRLNRFDIKWINDDDGFALPLDEIRSAIVNREVDIVVLSHVQYNSGYKLDIAAIGALCMEHDVIFIVDSTQSMGAIPIDLSQLHVDVLVGSNYKWMNAGFGTGIMYMSDSFLQKYPPVVGGHNSYTMLDGQWQYVSSVKSYEPGHPNLFGFTILEAAIQHKQQLGLTIIEKHNMQLLKLLLDNIGKARVSLLGDTTTGNRASFILLKDENGLSDLLKQHQIVATFRGGLVRISMHYYNTEADIIKLLETLDKL